MCVRTRGRILVAGGLVLMTALIGNRASLAQSAPARHPLIAHPIDEGQLVTLAGNIRKEMTPAHDRGVVADNLVLRMNLQLNRPPEVQRAMDDLVIQMHDQNSHEYHKWLKADQIAEQFGPSDSDIEAASLWLQSHGFKIEVVHRANGVIGFSGTAASVREAFHTEIHRLSVNGKERMANLSDPKIPAALTPAIAGIVALNNFQPHSQVAPHGLYTFVCQSAVCLTQSDPNYIWYALVPDDVHKIYDMNPLYAAGITGKGKTIVVAEDSDVYSASDWQVFRTTFGLAQRFPHGSFTQIHPQSADDPDGANTCTDPGVNSDDFEAILDAEWASATAPDATIVAAVCSGGAQGSGGMDFGAGVFTAVQNIVTGRSPTPDIISISYGQGETEGGAAYNAFINQLYEIAVLEGISIFVSSGDSGADGDYADYLSELGQYGINVNGEASTPYNVAVGGTDFADTYFGQNTRYWGANNAIYYGSALSYIPEIPWNDSCAGQLLAQYYGFEISYGVNGFCNSSVVLQPSSESQPFSGEQAAIAIAGSGGPSACAYGVPSIPGVVSGSCRGYRKPFFQTLVRGNPNDGVRDIPDVSLFAANGDWAHYLIICYSDPTPGFFGYPCTGAPSGWGGGGGTSFSTPMMAGIQALINQAAGERQGNPDFVYYALAAFEYDTGRSGRCNATLGNQVDPSCIFHDVTLGDNEVNCQPLTDSNGNTIGTFNCYIPSGGTGVVSLSNTSYEPAYPATPGWDFATGLGSVDAYNLVKAWPGSRLH